MAEVGFYHLQHTSLERALPRLLEKAVERGMRAVVLGGSQERIDALDTALWTYDPGSFLPHGTARDGHADAQPIYLTTQEENPNGATLLVLVDGAESDRLGDYARCADLFDGADAAAVAAARQRWTRYRGAGHEVTYWQQTADGRWEKRG